MDIVEDFQNLDIFLDENEFEENSDKRPTCQECLRPLITCWCRWIQSVDISDDSMIVILQHRNEKKRQIRTAQMLAKGISNNKCKIFIKSKVSTIEDSDCLTEEERQLRQLLRRPDVYILYPTKTSSDAAEIFVQNRRKSSSYVLVVLDGTWREAKKMFVRSPVLQRLPAIHLDLRRVERKSEYVVRTQPTEQCLSTVEIVAHTVAILENDDSIVDKLVAPLRALCSIQIRHGAVIHDSKEIKKDLDQFCKENTRRNPKNVLSHIHDSC